MTEGPAGMLHPDDMPADLETRSRVDLKASGARRYAADPSTSITTAVWQFRGVRKGACTVFPHIAPNSMAEFYHDVRHCRRFLAHHANFDVSMIRGQNPFCDIPLHKIDCTMARAQAIALPAGLDKLCKTLNIQGKDPAGHALVMATCKPDKHGNFREIEQEYRALLAYNWQDVECLINVDSRIPHLSPEERIIWERTWRKNEIGLPIDVELATAIALRRQEIEQETSLKLMAITDNAVTKLSQRKRIQDWCNSGNRAVGLESTQKHIVAEALANQDMHPDAREVLELLQAEGGSAPLKAQALLDRHVGGWYKDGTRYFGARSGRGTSEGANMFNIARPSGKYDGKEGRPTIDSVIEGLKRGEKYNNTALTDCLRGTIVAPQGYLVCDNDESNAEYRLAMWMANDTERLKLLAENGDPYMHNAIQMGWCPPGSTKHTHPRERQDNKPVTLGGNYGLGYRTYMSHQRRLGRNIDEIKAKSDIYGYRDANPRLFARDGLLATLENAFKFAIYEQPGRVFPAGKVAFRKDSNGTVWMMLPSGREVPHWDAHITYTGEAGFWRAKFGTMLRQKVFGGSLLEIACQSMTRDLVTAAEADIERELPDVVLVLDVYDSILALAPEAVAKERGAQMREIMKRPRHWTAGLPLDCDGYESQRMRK